MTRRVPVLDLALAGIAASMLATLLLVPPTAYLAPALEPWAIGLSGVWTLWRLWGLDRALRERAAWRINFPWTIALGDLALPKGVCLGRGFRWEQQHTQALEAALATEGALPVADDSRGGFPALHAVGRKQNQPVVLPFTEMVGHTLIVGTTRSGKTRLLEAAIEQLAPEEF